MTFMESLTKAIGGSKTRQIAAPPMLPLSYLSSESIPSESIPSKRKSTAKSSFRTSTSSSQTASAAPTSQTISIASTSSSAANSRKVSSNSGRKKVVSFASTENDLSGSSSGPHVRFYAPDTSHNSHLVITLAANMRERSTDLVMQHDFLLRPFVNLSRACRPYMGNGFDGGSAYPFVDTMGNRVRAVQNPMLAYILEISSMLAIFDTMLQDVYAIDSSTLVALGSQLEQTEALIKHLYKLEDMINSFLKWGERKPCRLDVVARTREDFLPHMRAAKDHAESIILELKPLHDKVLRWRKVARPSSGSYVMEL